jgi:hypothetical protein
MLLRKALLADKGLAVDHYDEEIAAVESRIAKAKNEVRKVLIIYDHTVSHHE